MALLDLRARWQHTVLGRSRGLGALTGGAILSETADQFISVALIWVVLTTTHSPADAGLVVLCRRIPEIVSGPLLGSWFDRWAPVPLTAAGYLFRGGAVAVIVVMTRLGTTNMAVLLAICVFMGVTNPLAKVGTRVMLPRLIAERDLHVANGVLTIGDQFPYLVGPALGGALAGFAGAWSLLVPAGMCLLATVLLVGVRLGPPPHASASASGGQASGRASWYGFRPLLSVPVVRAMMLLTTLYYISYGPLLTAIPMYARQVLHTGGAGYGAMWSAMGVGSLLGLVAIPRLSGMRPAVVNSIGAVLWGVILLPLSLVGVLPVALAIMFVGGFVWAPYAATEISVIQQSVPGDQHGSVFGARRSVIVASSPSGAALGGLMLEHLSATRVIALSSIACILGGTTCLALPSVRKTRPLRPTPTPEPATTG